jgi:hypothetical protein
MGYLGTSALGAKSRFTPRSFFVIALRKSTGNSTDTLGRLWLVQPTRRTPDFAEEAAFALSIAQEFSDPEEERYEVWLVSVRMCRAVVVKVTVAR